MHQIGAAEAHEIAQLPAIERRASDLFLAVPATAALPLHLTPIETFEAARRAGLLWVARVGGAPVGFALVQRLGDALHLEELDVLPEQGRKGLGRALVRRVCDEAAAQHRPLTLCTFRDVPWNAPFYERLGFRALRTGEMPPALARRAAEEAARGLPVELRVAMTFVGGAGG